MKTNELTAGYSIFGNKGACFANQCHIFKEGLDFGTLCGTPMLSTNWAEINKVDEICCSKCLAIYNEQNPKKEWFIDTKHYENMSSGTNGSFAQSMAQAFYRGDWDNRSKLVAAFPNLFPSDYRYT